MLQIYLLYGLLFLYLFVPNVILKTLFCEISWLPHQPTSTNALFIQYHNEIGGIGKLMHAVNAKLDSRSISAFTFVCCIYIYDSINNQSQCHMECITLSKNTSYLKLRHLSLITTFIFFLTIFCNLLRLVVKQSNDRNLEMAPIWDINSVTHVTHSLHNVTRFYSGCLCLSQRWFLSCPACGYCCEEVNVGHFWQSFVIVMDNQTQGSLVNGKWKLVFSGL